MHDTAILEALPVDDSEDEDAPSMPATMVIRMGRTLRLSREELERFCALNRDLRIEQEANGDLVIMAPAFSESGEQNASLTTEVSLWARKHGGRVYDSSSGFTLPNKAMRAPDVSWISPERYEQVPKEEWKKFAKVCPDFVLELRSTSDRLPKLQKKMAEYIANGARLGWLIDSLEKQVFVYRPDAPVEHLLNPATLSGDPVLAGFTLDLARVW